MSLREDLIPLVDDVRGCPQALGIRPRTVARVERTWSGGALGSGSHSEVEQLLEPTPLVKSASRYAYASGGRIQEGDLRVSQVSATYLESWLQGESLAEGVEVYWRVDGEAWRIVSAEERAFEWVLILRRLAR